MIRITVWDKKSGDIVLVDTAKSRDDIKITNKYIYVDGAIFKRRVNRGFYRIDYLE